MCCKQAKRPWKGLGPFIRQRRLALKLSQQDLARKADMSLRQLAALESGTAYDPMSSTLKRLADALDASTDDMLGRMRRCA